MNLSITTMMIFITTLLIFSMTYHPESQLESKKSWILDEIPTIMGTETLSLQKLFYPNNFTITIMMVITLFFSMMCLSHIVTTDEGPLQMKN